MKDKTAPRLLVFVPAQRSAGGRPSLGATTVVRYAIVGDGGGSGEAPLSLLPRARETDLVFDCGDVFLTVIDAPRLAEARLRQALPNLLEDRLLGNPADCQFAFDAARGRGKGEAGSLPVAVIDRGLLTRAIDVIGSRHRLRAAYSEIHLLPMPAEGELAVRAEHGRAVVRSGAYEGFAFELGEPDSVPSALLLAVRQRGIGRIRAFGSDAARLAALAAPLGVAVDASGQNLDAAAAAGAVNLLQGGFAPRGSLGSFAAQRIELKQIKALAVWGAVAAATFIAGLNLYWMKLSSEEKALRGGMETAFRSAFPEATAVVDPVLQTRRQLGALRARAGVASADDFSVLGTQAGQILSMGPIGTLAGLEYRDGALRLKFQPGSAPDANLQNVMRSRAVQVGLTLQFDADGSARLAPADK
jgi:general secretion pathway protein L